MDCRRQRPVYVQRLVKKNKKPRKEPFHKITPHSFRHSFCTRKANKHADSATVQAEMTG
ncbi:hypothetical protein A4V01_22295 [Erysipelotrichaceae bacterium I46]|nr:hypothetical protein A4V01_22295 [Erysipelotrichaceae bacterium I46]ASU20802.1 hypothetical protein ADH65_21135 [[Clostridium] innocuum]